MFPRSINLQNVGQGTTFFQRSASIKVLKHSPKMFRFNGIGPLCVELIPPKGKLQNRRIINPLNSPHGPTIEQPT